VIIHEMNATFGTLENSRLSLCEGLNIIEGRNESGKSTWCAFILAMLYGINSSERDTKTALAVKNRYRPWSGSPMSGTMRVGSDRLGELTLERRSTSASPMRDFQAYDPSGNLLKLPEAGIGELLLGVGRETFERSAFIDHPEIPSGAGELERRILSLVSSGEENVSYTEAVNRLKEWQRKLKYNRKSGEIPELEDRIEKLFAASDTLKNKAEGLATRSARLKELEAERETLLKELSAHEAAEKSAALNRLRSAEARLEEAETDVCETAKILPPGNPTAEEIRMLEREVHAEAERRKFAEAQSALIIEKRNQIDKLEADLSSFKPFAGCPLREAEDLARRDKETLQSLSAGRIQLQILKKSAFLTLIPILISAALILFSDKMFIPYTYSIIASAVLTAIFAASILIVSRLQAKRRLKAIRQAIYEKYGLFDIFDLDERLASYKSMHDSLAGLKADVKNLQDKLDGMTHISPEVISRIYEIFPELENSSDIRNGITQSAATALAAIEKHNRAQMLMLSAKQVVEALRSNIDPDAAQVSEPIPQPTMAKKEAESRLELVENMLSSLRREIALIEGSMENDRSFEELDAEIKRLSERLAVLNRGYEAISLALDALGEADRRLRERFSPALNSAAAEIFSAFTSCKYNKVVISRELTAMAGSGGSEGLRRALELSRGTVDQLYLAVRFAICRIITPPGYTLPVILDDAFMSFDDTRLRAALDWLYEESKTRQILLFTCHKRESDYLRNRPGVLVHHIGC